jgi:uncharacterized membrane protein YczE
VVVIGWLLGGVLGVGTLLYAVAIGPLVQVFLPFFIVELPEFLRGASLPPEQRRV